MATQIGTVIDGKYEILKQIGKGGMSTVYLAMDKRLNKQWAVKEISRKGFGKNNEEIINEVPADAEMMKALDHPAIPTIVDIIDHRDNEFIYVVMDYVEGESLDKVLAEYGAQAQDMVIDWAKQICEAFSYLHSQKPPIIYRDMKPANVMLKPEGNIKIIDFGIAREYKEGNLADTTVLGTKGYASPEHYGGRQTDERSDIYTLGMTMHHLLTGVDPRPADYIYAPIRQWNPELSGGLERIIDKCVSPDPKDRYQSCNELLYALDHYTEEEDSFKKKQKRKLLSFVLSISLAVIFAISGLITNNLAISAENNNYVDLIKIKNLEYTVAYEQIDKAVHIDKSKIDAYKEFLEYICVDHNIDTEEYQGISTILNNVDEISLDEAFAQLYFKAGVDIFCYYDFENNADLKETALKSISFFESIKDDSFSVSEAANSFYNICNFYIDDNGNSVADIDYVAKYQEYFDSINKCMEFLVAYKDNENSEFLRLAMYQATANYINLHGKEILKYGKVDENTVISLLDKIYEYAQRIEIPEVDHDKRYQTQNYILNKIPEYKNNIKNTYKNLNR